MIRKVFFNDDGSELTYHVRDGQLSIEIVKVFPDGISTFEFELADALTFINELQKLKKYLHEKV